MTAIVQVSIIVFVEQTHWISSALTHCQRKIVVSPRASLIFGTYIRSTMATAESTSIGPVDTAG